jgi:xanthine dehydrogenase accessory factor
MAVAQDGELVGSIGGGVMEVDLVNESRGILSEPPSAGDGLTHHVKEQIHRRDVPNSSGMICSGRQAVIFKLLTPSNAGAVQKMIQSIAHAETSHLTIGHDNFIVEPGERGPENEFEFQQVSEIDFIYRERLGPKYDLYVVGGGHCALALSEIMSKIDFRIHIFDDRPDLNTLEKNEFADEITVIDSYETIAEHIPCSPRAYVVVMTLGYKTDAIVMRKLIDKQFKYLGVLGSKAKMGTLIKELKAEGLPVERLEHIRTPIGLAINSRTPEEIAVSIAAEIISIKNAD